MNMLGVYYNRLHSSALPTLPPRLASSSFTSGGGCPRTWPRYWTTEAFLTSLPTVTTSPTSAFDMCSYSHHCRMSQTGQCVGLIPHPLLCNAYDHHPMRMAPGWL